MRTMGIRRRVTTWRNRADMAEQMLRDDDRQIVLSERGEGQCQGYIEAMRACADELELTITKASQRETLT